MSVCVERYGVPLPVLECIDPSIIELSVFVCRGKEIKSLSDCLQVCFSPACHYRLFLVYAREIIILDTDLKQMVGVVSSERNSSIFHQILPCRQRDLIYCLHENGCVSVRVHQRVGLPSALPTSPGSPSDYEVHYDLYTHSEALRISKTCQVFLATLCPSSEMQVAVLTSEGRVLFWQLEFHQVGLSNGSLGRGQEDSLAVMSSRPISAPKPMVDLEKAWEEGGHLEDEEEEEEMWQLGKCWTLSDSIAPHWFSPPTGDYMSCM